MIELYVIVCVVGFYSLISATYAWVLIHVITGKSVWEWIMRILED